MNDPFVDGVGPLSDDDRIGHWLAELKQEDLRAQAAGEPAGNYGEEFAEAVHMLDAMRARLAASEAKRREAEKERAILLLDPKNRLDGYRELGQKCYALETRAMNAEAAIKRAGRTLAGALDVQPLFDAAKETLAPWMPLLDGIVALRERAAKAEADLAAARKRLEEAEGLLRDSLGELQWCGGSHSFSPPLSETQGPGDTGYAHAGWLAGPLVVIGRIRAFLAARPEEEK